MQHPTSPLTPFPATLPRIRRRTHTHPALCLRVSVANPICRSFVFMVLRIALPANPFVSQSSALPPGVTRDRLRYRSTSALSVPQWQKNRGHPPPDLHNFSAPINTFRMNTCKSVSKQRTLSPFRMNTYAKTGGGGPSSFVCLVCLVCLRLPSLSVAAYTSKLRCKTPCSAWKHFASKCVPRCASRCLSSSPRSAG
jgi:hypothetical protein